MGFLANGDIAAKKYAEVPPGEHQTLNPEPPAQHATASPRRLAPSLPANFRVPFLLPFLLISHSFSSFPSLLLSLLPSMQSLSSLLPSQPPPSIARHPLPHAPLPSIVPTPAANPLQGGAEAEGTREA